MAPRKGTQNMGSKMLIDASHPEETRVVVIRGNRIEEFDFESATRRQLKGNIYLAKVTRVEPSLQAAFVEYGGNRHGFLAFSEIHPDYYQIPLADRMALLQEEEEAHAREDEDQNGNNHQEPRPSSRRRKRSEPRKRSSGTDKTVAAEAAAEAASTEDVEVSTTDADTGANAESNMDVEAPSGGDVPLATSHDTPALTDAVTSEDEQDLHEDGEEEEEEEEEEEGEEDEEEESVDEADDGDAATAEEEVDRLSDKDEPANVSAAADSSGAAERAEDNGDDGAVEAIAPAPHLEHGVPGELGNGVEDVEEDIEDQTIESVGAEDALEEVPQRSRKPQRRQYKIQEVIKRRQVILVQVVKEERGNKGAALTTYLSLAGRYCVLMPNTARGGGISRKITDSGDRRRLKDVAKEIEVPQGMGLIVRTAGAQRTKSEIKRDYDYLLRLWESVRDLTLKSTAPALVYEEGSLVKRAIRDLYTKDVDEVIVEGDGAYREAKDFMKMLMPSHAKNVKPYKDTRPLFSRFQAESQLDGLYSPTVTLPSGGYMVINQTEALVSVDINSGKATREHNIEDTALKTNLEAADEVARQLRLRDLAGLVVIDFIDMEEKRNNRNVERRLKEALKNDRARIQVGRISHFGLLEMSRQRLRPGLLEGSSRTCPHCEGRGIVRSISSCGLSVLRAIEEHLIARKPENLTVKCTREIAFYILNEKRDNLLSIETTYGISIFITPSEDVKGSQAVIERAVDRNIPPRKVQAAPVRIDSAFAEEEDEVVEAEPVAAEAAEDEAEAAGERPLQAGERDETGRKRRRRRGRRGGRGRDEQQVQGEAQEEVPGLGDQPVVEAGGEMDVVFKPETEGEAAPAATDEAGADEIGTEAVSEAGSEERPSKLARRDRWGRGRKPREREEDQPELVSAAGTEEAREGAVVVEMPQSAAPPPPPQNEAAPPAEEPPRRWQPPAPTVVVEPTQRKTGWWSKR